MNGAFVGTGIYPIFPARHVLEFQHEVPTRSKVCRAPFFQLLIIADPADCLRRAIVRSVARFFADAGVLVSAAKTIDAKFLSNTINNSRKLSLSRRKLVLAPHRSEANSICRGGLFMSQQIDQQYGRLPEKQFAVSLLSYRRGYLGFSLKKAVDPIGNVCASRALEGVHNQPLRPCWLRLPLDMKAI